MEQLPQAAGGADPGELAQRSECVAEQAAHGLPLRRLGRRQDVPRTGIAQHAYQGVLHWLLAIAAPVGRVIIRLGAASTGGVRREGRGGRAVACRNPFRRGHGVAKMGFACTRGSGRVAWANENCGVPASVPLL